jgi:hypothetical protein
VSSGELDVVKRTPIKSNMMSNKEARLPGIISMGGPEMPIQSNNSKKSTNVANFDEIDKMHVSNIDSR